jgi:hypothetical protein
MQNLTIEYHTKKNTTALAMSFLLLPGLSIQTIIISIGVIFALLPFFLYFFSLQAMSLLLFPLLFCPLFSLLLFANIRTLKLTPEGLAVPPLEALTNRLNCLIYFDDIKSAGLLDDPLTTNESKPLRLKLVTTYGYIILNLNVLTFDEREQILTAISTQAPAAAISQNIEDYKEMLWIAAANKPLDLPSYTQIWEQELAGKLAPTAFQPLNPGHLLDEQKLRVVKHLTMGGWSAIYLAQDEDLNLRILKESVLPADADNQEQEKAKKMFHKEASYLMRLNHPGLPEVYNYFQEGNRHYLVIDYITGEALPKRIAVNGPLHYLDVMAYACEIASILRYLHEQEPPIIHRDLSPDNLIIDSNQKIKLIDFGCANDFLGTATGTIIGKQSYMAPEQFQGKACPQSDLYSLGCVLYFMLTAQEPLALSQITREMLPENIPQVLKSLIKDLTSQKLDARLQKADEIITRLNQSTSSQQASEQPIDTVCA